MKKRIVFFVLFVLFLLIPLQAFAATTVSDNIATDTVWTKAGNPYILTETITVKNEASLTIEPGVVVKFNGPLSLNIGTETEGGKFYAKGTSSERITFTSAYNFPASRSWGNIGFYKGATSDSIIEYADIFYSGLTHGESIYFLSSSATISNVNTDGGVWIVNSSPTIKNSTFKNEVHFESSTGKIADSVITSGIQTPISIDSSSPMIENTKISKSTSGFIVVIKNVSSLEIKNSEISGTSQSISIDLNQSQPPVRAVLLENNKISGQISVFTSTSSYDYRFRPIILPIPKNLHPIISGNNISSGGISLDSVSPKILNNTFVNGGISSRSGYPEIVGNTFYNGGLSINNSGTTDSPSILISKNKLYGSGIDLESSSPMISNNFIYGNNGNGIGARVLSLPTIINNTISGNKVDGIYLETGWPTVKNNIIVGNGTGVSGLFPDVNRYFSYNLYANNGINFRIVEKKSTEIISGSFPLLDENDYHLKTGNDAVDRGVSDEAPADDIEGRARPIDGDKNGEAKIDIGAYEFSLDSSPGDIAGKIISQSTQQPITGSTARINNITMPADSNGNFRFTLVYPGIYTVYYDAPGYMGQTQVIEVKSGQVTMPPTVVMSNLNPTGQIKGRMVNANGRPIPGSTARINNITMFPYPAGGFAFTLMADGIYAVYYDAPGYISQTQVIPVVSGGITNTPTVIMSSSAKKKKVKKAKKAKKR